MPISDEIPGFKVHFAQKQHNPIGYIPDHLCAAKVREPYTGSEDTFVAGDRGRKRFESLLSDEEQYVIGRRTLTPPRGRETYLMKTGKRFMPIATRGGEMSNQQRRHLEPLQAAMPYGSGLPSVNWVRKKGILLNASTCELNLEVSMNRRKRLETTLERRNMISEASSGDHSYKAADRQPGFFAQGGLVVGSTNVLRASAKPSLRRSESLCARTEHKSLEATYGKLKRRLRHEAELRDVLTLTVDSSKQNQRVASWEERTGCWLVRPEDEDF
jgi:hypothetical protein